MKTGNRIGSVNLKPLQRVVIRSTMLISCCVVQLVFLNSAEAQDQDAAIQKLIGSAVSDVGPEYRGIGDAIVRFSNRDFEGAKLLLEKAQREHPELAPVGVMMGQLYRAANNGGAARVSLEQAVRDNPDDPEAYIHFADNALQQRRFTDAHLIYTKAKELCDVYTLNPKRKRNLGTRALNGMATIAEARQQWEVAEEFLRQVVEAEPEDAGPQTRLGRALFQQDRFEEAYAIFKKVRDLDPLKNPLAEINMAQLYQQGGKNANAKKLIGLARERDSQGINTQLAAARWAVQTGDASLAKEATQMAKSIDTSLIDVHILEGFLARYEDDYDTAEKALETAHLMSPANGAVLNQLPALLVEQPDEAKRAKALEYARLNSMVYNDRAKPSGRNAAAVLAWVLHSLGNTVQAQQQLQAVIQSGGVTDADATYYIAKILDIGGRPEAARQLLKPVMSSKQLFPSRPDAEALYAKVGSAN